jgi:hypothetical protein
MVIIFAACGSILLLQTQTFYYTKHFPAAIFYSLPIIAECFIKLFLQWIFSNFYRDFSLIPQKTKSGMSSVFIASRGSWKPTQ